MYNTGKADRFIYVDKLSTSQDLQPACYELLSEMNQMWNTTFSPPFQLPPYVNYQLMLNHLQDLSFSKG